MAYVIAAIVMTLSVLDGNFLIASLFKCDISYLWHIVWSLCICRASCQHVAVYQYSKHTWYSYLPVTWPVCQSVCVCVCWSVCLCVR